MTERQTDSINQLALLGHEVYSLFPESLHKVINKVFVFVGVPVLREDGCRGLGLPRTFIRWLRFYVERNSNIISNQILQISL